MRAVPDGASFLRRCWAFDDFAIVAAAAQDVGGLRDEGVEQIDADAHVGGKHDGNPPGGLFDGAAFGGVEPGGADDPRDAGGGQLRRGGGGGGVEAEIDGDGGARGQRRAEVGGHAHAEGADAGGGARVLSDQRRVGAVDGAGQFEAGHGTAGDEPGDGLAHAAGRAQQQDFRGGSHGYFTRPHFRRVARSLPLLSRPISHSGRR
jgi:hypothetical protein